MAPQRDLELELRDWLTSMPTLTAAPELHADSIEALRRRRQRPRAIASFRSGTWPPARPIARSLVLVGLILLLVIGSALVVAVGGERILPRPFPTQRPSTTQVQHPAPLEQQKNRFEVPFAYTIPLESALREDDTSVTELLGWSSGDPVPGASLDLNSAQAWGPSANAAHGVMIGVGPIWGHGSTCCPGPATPGGPGRYQLRTDPAGFLIDLRSQSGVPMGAIEATKVDGRDALTASIEPGGTDLHFGAVQPGLVGNGYMFRYPSRLIATQVGGRLIFVQIWAQTKAGLDEWMPTAMQFVDSIRFLDAGPTPGSPSASASATGGAACAGPSPRSGGSARG